MANMADEALKAFNKGQNTGSMFKLDLDVLKQQRINAESYVRVWLTAWTTKLGAEEFEIIKKHKITWLGQSVDVPAGYPPTGIPANVNQLLVLANAGKCGDEYIGSVNLEQNDEILILGRLSGDVIANAQTDYYDRHAAIRKAMESFRHYATVALGAKLNGPFDQGLIKGYNQLL